MKSLPEQVSTSMEVWLLQLSAQEQRISLKSAESYRLQLMYAPNSKNITLNTETNLKENGS